MRYLFPFLFAILFLTFSCNRGKRTQANEETIDSLVINSFRITNTISETLIPSAKKELANWEGYNKLDDFIISYYSISVSDALVNAEKLTELVRSVKDTITVSKLEKPNVIARFNVLHNETLRLADMATIPSISDEEVSEQVHQILEVFSSVNSKINTIYKAQDLQNALDVDTEIPIGVGEDDEDTEELEDYKKQPKRKLIKKT